MPSRMLITILLSLYRFSISVCEGFGPAYKVIVDCVEVELGSLFSIYDFHKATQFEF